VRPHDPTLRVGEAHTLVDGSAYTATPGLIDCHGHITVLGLDGPAMDTMLGGSMLVYVEKILHTTLVDGGVTTMRDIGGATHREAPGGPGLISGRGSARDLHALDRRAPTVGPILPATVACGRAPADPARSWTAWSLARARIAACSAA
jgi:hypothetical protein